MRQRYSQQILQSVIEQYDNLEKIKQHMAATGSSEKGIFELGKEPAIRNLGLLSAKPQIYLLNGKETDVSDALKQKIKAAGAVYIIEDLSSATSLDALVVEAYKILDLISFFTTGADETRAWPILRGAKAPEAAGAIHTDFQKKFIRAEVVSWQKLLEAGSWAAARQKGWLRLEGKEYVFQDGDVAEFRHG